MSRMNAWIYNPLNLNQLYFSDIIFYGQNNTKSKNSVFFYQQNKSKILSFMWQNCVHFKLKLFAINLKFLNQTQKGFLLNLSELKP
jgi:hypothetical protein